MKSRLETKYGTRKKRCKSFWVVLCFVVIVTVCHIFSKLRVDGAAVLVIAYHGLSWMQCLLSDLSEF